MSAMTYRGKTIPVLTLEPDWSNQVTITAVYRSVIFESLDTSEERHGLSPRPLYRVAYQALTLSGAESGYCRRITDLSGAVPVCCPMWTDYAILTSAVAIGGTTLAVDSTDQSLWQVLQDYCLVRSDWRTWELLQVALVSSTTITLVDPTTKLWPSGARVYPVVFGRLTRQDWTALTDEHSNVPVQVDEIFNLIGNQGRVES